MSGGGILAAGSPRTLGSSTGRFRIVRAVTLYGGEAPCPATLKSGELLPDGSGQEIEIFQEAVTNRFFAPWTLHSYLPLPERGLVGTQVRPSSYSPSSAIAR
jgi:hypothetical protein